METTLEFINHACLRIDCGSTTLLCDPWFDGTVFNDSWAPLVTGHLKPLGQNLAIWISHEHPDHLHFPTLRKIREQFQGSATVYYRRQTNSNVGDAIKKLGFEFVELSEERSQEIAPGLKLTSYPRGSDAAVVIQAGAKTFLNQNDCLLSRKQVKAIRARFPKIEAWFFQFSLAGYYANEDQPKALARARDGHVDLIRSYFAVLQPDTYVPFASFVYFCKPGNWYLNAHRVSPQEALATVPPGRGQLLWPGDLLAPGAAEERNAKNVELWDKAAQVVKPHALAPSPEWSTLERAARDCFANRA